MSSVDEDVEQWNFLFHCLWEEISKTTLENCLTVSTNFFHMYMLGPSSLTSVCLYLPTDVYKNAADLIHNSPN